ncbi:hypothetical protein K1T71_000334 [Dendrolimus kikuchii]|uniref:Uncharacterized protein n=1 Tax=Dendrolimus kikuchii TaxID=765133 RepID=A0ACC1DJ33_9NEOP|nr:hypothetical protein K1T71_000334 [Dendrolimus kikuchii]
MTTASLLLITTTFSVNSEKSDKDENNAANCLRNIVAECAKQLRETPTAREQALSILREWIYQNTDIKNVRQDEPFLLRFLRYKKYSIPMAQQTLLKYLSLRKYYPEIFKNIDSEDPRLQEIINDGYIVVSPVRDNKGQQVIVYRMNKLNIQKFTCWDICRVHALIYESLVDDPTNQICGFCHVGDGNGASGAHIAMWNPTDFARLMKWGEQSIPMRHKDFHFINVPAGMKYIIDFAISKTKPKFADRIHLYSNLSQLHKRMDVNCLPSVFGGNIKFEDMLDYTKQLISEHRKKILGLDDMEILSTRGIRSSRGKNQANGDVTSVEGSFRKLEID